MFEITRVNTKHSLYVKVPDTESKKLQLARELDVSYFELPSGSVKIESEDELEISDLRESLDFLRIPYVG